MAKMMRYMVTWGGESTYATASTPLEAIKRAAEEFHVKWQSVVSEMECTPLYEVKDGVRQW